VSVCPPIPLPGTQSELYVCLSAHPSACHPERAVRLSVRPSLCLAPRASCTSVYPPIPLPATQSELYVRLSAHPSARRPSVRHRVCQMQQGCLAQKVVCIYVCLSGCLSICPSGARLRLGAHGDLGTPSSPHVRDGARHVYGRSRCHVAALHCIQIDRKACVMQPETPGTEESSRKGACAGTEFCVVCVIQGRSCWILLTPTILCILGGVGAHCLRLNCSWAAVAFQGA
jgi:hypothetical protein